MSLVTACFDVFLVGSAVAIVALMALAAMTARDETWRDR